MDQPKKAFLSKGGVNLSEQKKTTSTSTGEKKTATKPTSVVDSNGNNVDSDIIVGDVITMTRNRQIPVDRAASMITGRIRVLFVNAIRNNKDNSDFGYDYGSFKYLDEILFDDLRYIIMCVMQYGSRGGIKMGHVIKMITDTARIIEYVIPDNDYETIKNVLKAVYSAYDF